MFSFEIFFIVFLVLALLVGLYDRVIGFKDISFCTIAGWHNGRGGGEGFDGCSKHAICSRCGKRVLQDSQGNWFESSYQPGESDGRESEHREQGGHGGSSSVSSV